MRITGIRVVHLGAPSTPDFRLNRNWAFVLVETDKGLAGTGECTLLGMQDAVDGAISQFATFLTGQDPRRVEHLWQQMYRHPFWRGGPVLSAALSGVDQALWDLAGQALGAPVYQLLGGPVRDRVRVYPRADTPGGPVEQVVEAQRQGFTAFKLSPPDPRGPFDEVALIDATLALLAEVRQAVGPRFDLMVDWHGRLSPAGAIRFLEGANPYRLLFAEEVIPPDNVPAYAQVARAAPGTPCATGERLFTRWGFRELIETRGVAVLQPDVCYAGGISELRRIAAHAETHYLQVAPHNPNGPVAMAASLHVAAAIPNFLILEYARKYPEFDAALREPLKLRNGHFELPTTPGLGVALDLDYVAQHPHNDVPIQSAWHTDGSVADI